ncbi:MAG: ATP-binding cassette domain-containing protein [Sulfurovum sp.]|nr:ATP-binding cassette domain-containing protein [Sulfurovum sp.]
MVKLDIQKTLHGSQGAMQLSLNLEIPKGQFVVIMGESGSGKTSLLRILSGLESSQSEIYVEGRNWASLPPQKRQIGFVFQDYALFANMTVEENLLFVHNDKALAKQLLAMSELHALATRNVQSLSGGQKQRVSLCRAMMNQPKLLLMDEPFSALDTSMRAKLQVEIAKFHKTFGTTTLMISHDAQTAHALADRIIVLSQGKSHTRWTAR